MGQWGNWMNATGCSVRIDFNLYLKIKNNNNSKVSCGYGISIRNRTCLPIGSINCVGDSVQVSTCDSGVSCASMYFYFYLYFLF